MKNIRNFVIIAHINHGKSTLADRFLELTNTVPLKKMRAQYLDQLELERERGVTIKMAPVRMSYSLQSTSYLLNLIDTPGHSDFSHEVSRALAAVEGAILLVDVTQGIQAQTLANFELARKASLKIISAVNKIDLASPQLEEVIKDVAALTGEKPENIFRISAKTGTGVEELLEGVIKFLPPPKEKNLPPLMFDYFYDNHRGIIASVRAFQEIKSGRDFKEVGYFTPELKLAPQLLPGEIGYAVTGIKDLNQMKFESPKPVVFVSFYPEEQDDYDELKKSLQKLRLNDAALNLSDDYNEVLGRGFKLGFLGKFHFEITAERLKREFGIDTVQSFPTVVYQSEGNKTLEPFVKVEVITPAEYLGKILQFKEVFRISEITTKSFGNRLLVEAVMPLSDFISDFDDKLKSVSAGFASFSYELIGYRESDLVKLEILVIGEVMPGLSRYVPRDKAATIGRSTLEKLKDLLPRQQFAQALQAAVGGRIVARENISAMRKDVTGYLYGGDRTRKMKLWQKQKRGKERLKAAGRVKIPAEIYRKLL